MQSCFWWRGWFCGVLLILGANSLSAAILQVDTKPGAAPFQTIQAALDQAKAGDTVHVRPGIYHERVQFKSGGTKDQPVVLEGEPGAIIDGSVNVALNWQLATDVGPGVYRVPLDFFPFTISVNGKLISTLDEKRVIETSKINTDRSNLRWREVFKNGVGDSGWNAVGGVAMYRKEEKDLLIRFKDQLDPRTLKLTVGPKEPCVQISGFDQCVVRGLTLRYAAYGVMIGNSIGSMVENCSVGPVDYGVHLGPGTEACTIRFNQMTMAPYAGSNPWMEGNWDVWQACKAGGFYDRYAIRMHSTKGRHEIHDNDIFDVWDGIEAGGDPGADGTANKECRIHHNYIHGVFDDGMESAGGQMKCQWYNNRLEYARCAFRIKDPVSGPLYIYRNIFFENKTDFRNWSPDAPKPVEVWVYHNTSTSDTAVAMVYGKTDVPITTPNYHYMNNLFWTRTWVATKKEYPLPDWKGDYNVFVKITPEFPVPWGSKAEYLNFMSEKNTLTPDERWESGIALAKEARREVHSVWVSKGGPGFVDAAKRNVALTKESPALACGVDLSKEAGGLLPGCGPGYFKGKRPDVGALQLGEAMPLLPRKPEVANKALALQ